MPYNEALRGYRLKVPVGYGLDWPRSFWMCYRTRKAYRYLAARQTINEVSSVWKDAFSLDLLKRCNLLLWSEVLRLCCEKVIFPTQLQHIYVPL